MRADMAKVLTERPRSGSWQKCRKTGLRMRKYDPEADYDFPIRASSGKVRQYGGNCRISADWTGPLYRYLCSQVGQPWNDVWSELCWYLDKRSIIGHHALHLYVENFVERHVVIENGQVFDKRGSSMKLYALWQGDLYAHPDTGLLCQIPSGYHRQDSQPRRREIRIDQNSSYIFIKNWWFKVEYKSLNPNVVEMETFSYNPFRAVGRLLTRELLTEDGKVIRYKNLNGEDTKRLRVITSKRQLSAQEVRKISQ